MNTGIVLSQVSSAAWDGGGPVASASVVIATHNRIDFLPDLLDALARQTVDVEVVIADDGSTDGTWEWLERAASRTALPLLALRLEHTGGPSLPRNTAAAHARSAVLAVTDDDCLPEPGWVAALLAALAGGAGIVQGLTRPVDAFHGTWDRAVSVTEPSGLWETCNLGFPRERFVGLGGFPTFRVLEHLPRGFGEDVVLGARAARGDGWAWAADAVVRHRWIRTDFRGHLQGIRRLSGFPWLAREVPEVASLLQGRVFLSRRTAEFDTALLSVVGAAVMRRPVLLVGAVPWVRSRSRSARRRSGRPFAVRLAQEAVADGVGLASLVEGSVRHRRVVL